MNTVKRILDLLEDKEIISVPSIAESTLTIDTPKDMRDNVVFEMISTERKYVQDLEALQVITIISSCWTHTQTVTDYYYSCRNT